MASTKLVAAFTLGVGAASAAALVIEWMRRRNKDVRELLVDQSMEGLAALRHVSRQNPIPALSRAVSEMESVSVKLLEAMDKSGNLRSGAETRLNAHQVVVLQKVEEELGRFSNTMSTILADAVVNSLPLACHLRRGGDIPRCAMDIGGTLCKVIIVDKGSEPKTPTPFREEGAMSLEFVGCPTLNLRFFTFPSSHLDQCIAFLQKLQIKHDVIPTTGGGGHKHREMFLDAMGVHLTPVEEMASVITGANQRLLSGEKEVFQYRWKKEGRREETAEPSPSSRRDSAWDKRGLDDRKVYVNFQAPRSPFPYLLVNIGSGVSIIRVDEGSHKRISGSCLGGGSFFGLVKQLTGAKTFEEAIKMSRKGDISNVDLLVSDIYGKGFCQGLGLPEDLIASSFGKVAVADEVEEGPRNEDMVRSLIFMFANNIAQVADLLAEREGIHNIIFSGGFIRESPYVWSKISFGLDFWSGSKRQALFMEHDSFLGALGALFLMK